MREELKQPNAPYTRSLPDKKKKKCCVFTFVRNENVFLPIWLKYYSRFFSGEDIYILDHSSDDNSITECRKRYNFNHTVIPFTSYNEQLKTDTARKKQAELLNSYEYVLYADADEIIVPNPRKYQGLYDYIKRFNGDYCFCKGYDLVQTEYEAPINGDIPILQQRKYWSFSPNYCKPLLSRIPLNWEIGFHSATNIKERRDNNLWLLHLHRMDFDMSWKKHQQIRNWKWDVSQYKDNTISNNFRIEDIETFKRFFRPPGFKKERWWYIAVYACIKLGCMAYKSPKTDDLRERSHTYFRHHTYREVPKCLRGEGI